MHQKIRLSIIILCLILLIGSIWAATTSSKTNPPKTTPASKTASAKVTVPREDILAEFDGGMITKQDLDKRIEKIPPQSQGRFKTIDGQTQILDMMAVEEIFYRKALDLNMQNDPAVVEKINAAKKQLLIQEYYKRNVTEKINLTEADKQKFYEENKKDFYVQPYITIMYLQPADEAEAQKAMAELRKGESFEAVSDKYSINTYAKGLQGKVKNIRLNGYLPGIGNDDELDAIIANAPVDSLALIGPNQTTTGWSIIKVMEKIEGRQRPYLECEAEVDQRLRPQKESEMLEQIIDKQKLAYKVNIDTQTLALINLREPHNNQELENINLVSATDPSLSMTVKALLEKFNKMSPQEQMMYVKGGGAEQMVNQELQRNLMYLDAVNDKSYDKYLSENEEFVQSQRYYVLQETYKNLVADEVSVTQEAAMEYYNSNLETYTTPPYRKIQAVWSKDEKSAKKAHKKFVSAAKKNNQKALDKVITQYSLKPTQAIIDNNYNNGVVTGIGPDQNLSSLIWSTEVGKVSPITTNAKGEILFFRVMEETPPTVTSFTEAEPRILGQLKRELEKSKMEDVTEQLNTQYAMKKYPEKLIIKLSAEELFDLADNSARQRKFKDATIYYDQIIQFYPNGSDDYKASFMKAFLLSEEVGNKELGLQLFKEFLVKYPTGELNESAQYMIDELEGRNPEFEDNEIEE
ncbi:MAG: peptidyl-prolyl cis-trans isomerase [Candidatus Cloacimonadaceae bacterium]